MELDVIFWYWWVLAVFLLAVEILAPGFFFLWIAVSAFVTGGLLLLLPAMALDMQLFIFSLLSVASTVVWKFYVKKLPIETDKPLLNKRSAQYIGRTFTLIEAIENGQGKIRVDDSIWKVQGEEDCAANSKVKVVAADGTILKVEKI